MQGIGLIPLHFATRKLAEFTIFHHYTKVFLQVSAIHQTESQKEGGKTIVLPPFLVLSSMIE